MKHFSIGALCVAMSLSVFSCGEQLVELDGGADGGRDGGSDVTRPTVVSSDPADTATAIVLNKRLTVVFSEAMNASTLSSSTFTVKQGTTDVAGTVTYAGTTATFVPTAALTANTLYAATISTSAKDVAGNALANAFTFSFTTGTISDSVAPTVLSTDPLPNALNVIQNKTLIVTFSEAIDLTTVTSSSFMLKQGTTSLTGTVTAQGDTATFVPAANLAANTLYTATVTTEVKDTAGNALASAYSWSFTTGLMLDQTNPTVISTGIRSGATGVELNKTLTVRFSEPMDSATLNMTTFTLKQGATALPGTVTHLGTSASFRPAANMIANTVYTATISTGAKDLAGNPLLAPYSWSFTTGPSLDQSLPTIISTDPVNASTGIVVNKTLSATFSEVIDATTLNGTTFTVKQGTTSIAGTITSLGNIAIFRPSTALNANVLITATFTTGVKDTAGNALAANYVWVITTGAATDAIAPTIVTLDPVAGDPAVVLNKTLIATFSEAMDPSTLNAATFTVTQPGGMAVRGSVTTLGNTVSFRAHEPLTASTTYTVSISNAARDTAGNSLGAAYTWSFTTGTLTSMVAPTVIAVTPRAGSNQAFVNTSVIATFSTAMDPTSINLATFTLRQGTTPIAGTVTSLGRTASFRPTGSLTANTTYTATLSPGVQDTAGLMLGTAFTWRFTTGMTTSTVAPIVVASDPIGGAIAVPVNKHISATFSALMDPTTIDATTFTLHQGTTPIAGSVSFLGMTGTFIPAVQLNAATTYMASIGTSVRNTSGTTLTTIYSWSFTTGATADIIAPTIISSRPSTGATNVSIGRRLTVTFSEAMSPTSLNETTFSVKQGALIIPGTVSLAAGGTAATFIGSSDFALNTAYIATISTGVMDSTGNALAAAGGFTFTTALCSQGRVQLGAAEDFAVLAGSMVTSTGATTVTGDVGVSPGSAVTGFTVGAITGTQHAGDATAGVALADLTAAYNAVDARTGCAVTLSGNLGGQTLNPGLYSSGSSLEISSGDLTLDAQGDADAIFIFQTASTLSTTSGRSVLLMGGAQARNIFWQVGTSATLGATTAFEGTVMANQTITLGNAATLNGRALAVAGAVTLDANTLITPAH